MNFLRFELRRSTSVCLRRFSSTASIRALVVAQHDNKSLHDVTLHVVSAAKALGGDVSVLVAGQKCDDVAQQAAKVSGVGQVLLSEDDALAHFLAENISSLIVDLQQKLGFSHVLTAATAAGKNYLPRVGAKLDAQPISDVTSIKSPDTFVRPIYAGNALQTVQSTDKVKLLTIRTTAFEKAKPTDKSAKVEKFAPVTSFPGLSKWVKDELNKSERPELGSARIIVSGGRALGSSANFKMLEELADKLGAAVGASRAAVDAGYVPNDYQIGQTGKVVAPDLYLAVGISGAIQHLAGMKDSKKIVAINKDQEAPIFQIADYGLVGDLFTMIPELTKEVEKVKQGRKG